MPERMICYCFEASALSKVVGWLQVVGSGLLWLGAGYNGYVCTIGLEALREGELSEEFLKELGDSETVKTDLTWMLALSILGLILETVAIVMGIVLLQGLYTKRPGLVGKWLIWAYIFQLITLIVWMVLLFGIGFTALGHYVIFGLVAHGFCIRVVLIHKADIDQGWDKMPLVET